MVRFLVSYRNFVPIVEGLRAQGLTVDENQWEPVEKQLRECVGYLACMYDAIKRPLRLLRLKSHLRRYHIPLITWNRDGPWHKGEKAWRLWLLKNLPIFDIYATHTLQDSADFAPHVIYLPNAAWTDGYHLAGVTLSELRDPSRYRYDVSFFGRLDAVRYPEMRRRADFFSELAQRLRPDGVVCEFRHNQNMSYAEQIDFIQRSRINLNFWAGCDDGSEKSWGLPERCYGVQACGGFLLSDDRRHAEDDFTTGVDWVSFADINDCERKIRHYLKHFSIARDIAEAAYARVLRDHTYVNRARSLLDVATAWRNRALRGTAG